MPDPVAAYGVGAVGSIIMGDNASDAAGDASDATLAAAQRSEDLNRERFALAQGYLDPYAGRANIAAQQLQAEMGLAQYGEQAAASNSVNAPGLDPFGNPNMGPSTAGQEPYPPMPEMPTAQHPAALRLKEQKLAEWEQKKAEVDQRNRMGEARKSPYAGAGVDAGTGQEYTARDISQIPGYQAAMDESLAAAEQSAVSSGSTAYGGRRLEAAGEVGAGVQQSYYTNYMNMLQNIANPTVATNLAGMGVGQGQSIGQQNIAAQGMASNYNLQGVAAQNAAWSDTMGGAVDMYSAYMGTPEKPKVETGRI